MCLCASEREFRCTLRAWPPAPPHVPTPLLRTPPCPLLVHMALSPPLSSRPTLLSLLAICVKNVSAPLAHNLRRLRPSFSRPCFICCLYPPPPLYRLPRSSAPAANRLSLSAARMGARACVCPPRCSLFSLSPAYRPRACAPLTSPTHCRWSCRGRRFPSALFATPLPLSHSLPARPKSPPRTRLPCARAPTDGARATSYQHPPH